MYQDCHEQVHVKLHWIMTKITRGVMVYTSKKCSPTAVHREHIYISESLLSATWFWHSYFSSILFWSSWCVSWLKGGYYRLLFPLYVSDIFLFKAEVAIQSTVVLEDAEISKEVKIRYEVGTQKTISHFWEMVTFFYSPGQVSLVWHLISHENLSSLAGERGKYYTCNILKLW